MNNITTIQLDKKLVEKLKRAKEYPRQTYNELLDRAVTVFVSLKKKTSAPLSTTKVFISIAISKNF